jgi:hypothetical protein
MRFITVGIERKQAHPAGENKRGQVIADGAHREVFA